MHHVLTSTSESSLFAVTAAPYLVLDTELRIAAANPAYLRATGRAAGELAGELMFDAFPDNPADPRRDRRSEPDRVFHPRAAPRHGP
ncbi:PAS domain-containing protein [Amycolatopsis sp. cmx-4-54]|uniref:PAS domain-containing protein n=1 Tax=Amycolatopsis sp. cmx-4-54 TaxID=2790936 RepID=UPI00397C40A1